MAELVNVGVADKHFKLFFPVDYDRIIQYHIAANYINLPSRPSHPSQLSHLLVVLHELVNFTTEYRCTTLYNK